MSAVEFKKERLAEKKRLLTLYSEAVTTLNAGVASYELSTGQSTQRVTRHDLGTLSNAISRLEGEIVMLENFLNGNGGVAYGRPCY